MKNKNVLVGHYLPLGGGLRTQSLEYAEAIGNYFLNFSSLDYSIIKMISFLVDENTDNLGFSIVAYIRNTQTKWNLLESWLKSSGYEKEAKNWKEKFNCYIKFRNKLAHAIWPSLDTEGFVDVAIESNGEVYLENDKITIEKIFEVNDEMCESIRDFDEFIKYLGVQL